MDRGRVQAESQFMFRLQSVGGFGGKSDQLNAYNVFLRDPAFFERDLARYQSVTRESLMATVGQFVNHRHRVALSLVPRDRLDLALPDSTVAVVS
jgi:zinc protease